MGWGVRALVLYEVWHARRSAGTLASGPVLASWVEVLRGFFGRSLAYLHPYWPQALFVGFGLALEVGFNVAFPLSVRALIDLAIVPRDFTVLVRILVLLSLMFLIAAIAGVGMDYTLARIGSRLLGDLRLRLFTHLQRLSAEFFARSQVSTLMGHFSTEAPTIARTLTREVPVAFRSGLQLIVTVVVLFALEWHLALVTLAALPLALIGPRLLARRAGNARSVDTALQGHVGSFEQESIDGHAVLRGFGLREAAVIRLRELLAEVGQTSARASFFGQLTGRTTYLGVTVVQLLVISSGAVLAFQGYLSTGSLIGFIGLLVYVGAAFSGLSESVPACLEAAAAMLRVEQLLAQQPSIADAPGATVLPRLTRKIRLDGVSFSYTGVQRNLRNVSLFIGAGESVAFVGRSGSGKSTILNLITRFHDPLEGSVRIDGHDIRQVTQESLRAQMGIVFQESFLFDTTIRQNIRYGRLEATNAEVEAAARAAQIHELILGLPQGYDTTVGERGGRLSGGQKQRLALARAIVRDPAILVLDEATSALDPGTESAFNATLAKLRLTRTVLSVTHRLSSAVNADRIFVLDDGELVEQGTHATLLELGGVYHQLWHQQAGFSVSEDGRRAEISPERVRAIPLFQHVDNTHLAAVGNRFVSESFAAGEVIMRSGEPGEKFYVVVRGSVEVLGPDQRPFAVLEQGDFFGELALLDAAPRAATVRARSTCLLLALARQQFTNLLDLEPGLRTAITRAASVRRGALTAAA